MSNTPRLTKAQRKIEALVKGWIYIDMFHLSIPVFISDVDRVAWLSHHQMEFSTLDPDKKVAAIAGWASDPEGCRCIYMVLPLGVTSATWAHEASHVVDFVIEYLGLDPGLEGTEARAYMLGHIFSSIEDIMKPLIASQPEVSTNEKPRPITPAPIVPMCSCARGTTWR
jgi:hypothetical protein